MELRLKSFQIDIMMYRDSFLILKYQRIFMVFSWAYFAFQDLQEGK